MTVGDGSGLALNPGETVQSKIVHQSRQLMQGRSNSVGRFTLRSGVGATSTTVSATSTTSGTGNAGFGVTCGPGSVPLLTPLTLNASNMKYFIFSTDVYLGSFIVQHTSSTSTDMTFGYAILG